MAGGAYRPTPDAEDTAHNGAAEPLLAHHSNPKLDAPPRKPLSLRSLASIREYFEGLDATPGYWLFLALVFGVSSGVVAFVYDQYFEAILKLVWEVSAFCTSYRAWHCMLRLLP
jgi:hypothetical protein